MPLNIDDLILPCQACGGSGKAQEEKQPDGGGNTFGQHRIAGRRVAQGWGEHTCDTCKGAGRYELTDTGKALFQLYEILSKQRRVM